MVDYHPIILGQMNQYLNILGDSSVSLPSKTDVLLIDPGHRVARTFQMEQNKESIEFLQLSEEKHLEYVAAGAAVFTATSDLAEHRDIDTDELNKAAEYNTHRPSVNSRQI
jgi:hypothetical protein